MVDYKTNVSKNHDENRTLKRELDSLKEILEERKLRNMQKKMSTSNPTNPNLLQSPSDVKDSTGQLSPVEPKVANYGGPAKLKPFDPKQSKEINPRRPSALNFIPEVLLLPKKKAMIFKKKVSLEDIAEVSERLSLHLQHQKVAIEQVYNILSKKSDSNEEISIKELKELLKVAPFEVQSDRDRDFLSRYMIEDNSEDKIIYDERLSAPVATVKSVFRAVLGAYEILPPDAEREVAARIRRILTSNYTKLASDFAGLKSKSGDTCSKEKLLQTFKACDISLDTQEIGLIVTKLYGLTLNSKQLKFFECFKLFDVRSATLSSSQIDSR